jgi:hypothetical protein
MPVEEGKELLAELMEFAMQPRFVYLINGRLAIS